jgi:hypothetical protein
MNLLLLLALAVPLSCLALLSLLALLGVMTRGGVIHVRNVDGLDAMAILRFHEREIPKPGR